MSSQCAAFLLYLHYIGIFSFIFRFLICIICVLNIETVGPIKAVLNLCTASFSLFSPPEMSRGGNEVR